MRRVRNQMLALTMPGVFAALMGWIVLNDLAESILLGALFAVAAVSTMLKIMGDDISESRQGRAR